MTEVMLKKEFGSLRPVDDEGYRVLGNIGSGVSVIADIKDPRRRSGKQFRYWFAILNVVWENSDAIQKYFKNFENYRHKVIIAIGRYDEFKNKDGTSDRIAHSIAFGKMDQDEFTQTVDDTLTFFEDELNIPRKELEREARERIGE